MSKEPYNPFEDIATTMHKLLQDERILQLCEQREQYWNSVKLYQEKLEETEAILAKKKEELANIQENAGSSQRVSPDIAYNESFIKDGELPIPPEQIPDMQDSRLRNLIQEIAKNKFLIENLNKQIIELKSTRSRQAPAKNN